jgi:DNA polymerase I
MNNETNINQNGALGDVILVDAYNLIYRAYHGNQAPLKNKAGMPTNALYTFAKMMQTMRKDYDNIEFATSVFDGGENFRKEIDAEYKANRKPMPDDLKVQMEHIPRMLDILGWPVIKAQNEEADDIIGTLALRAATKGHNVYIHSSDKDFRAIVDERITVVDTMSKINYTRQAVFEKMGVYPENVMSYLALFGDGSDNVIGIDGIGTKTAAKLLTTYGDINGLIANQADVKGVVGENLRKAIAEGVLAKNLSLIGLKTDVKLDLKKKDITLRPVNVEAWSAFCEEMDFRTFNFNPVKFGK